MSWVDVERRGCCQQQKSGVTERSQSGAGSVRQRCSPARNVVTVAGMRWVFMFISHLYKTTGLWPFMSLQIVLVLTFRELAGGIIIEQTKDHATSVVMESFRKIVKRQPSDNLLRDSELYRCVYRVFSPSITCFLMLCFSLSSFGLKYTQIVKRLKRPDN